MKLLCSTLFHISQIVISSKQNKKHTYFTLDYGIKYHQFVQYYFHKMIESRGGVIKI